MDLNQLMANLNFWIRSMIMATITTFVVAAIAMFLWNWQLVTAFSLPVVNYWTVVAVIAIIQFIRIKS